MTDLDPDKIMAEHADHRRGMVRDCLIGYSEGVHERCLPYRLAAENAALRERIGRLVVAEGYDPQRDCLVIRVDRDALPEGEQ